VTNLNVVSNHPQVTTISNQQGRLEIWNWNYSQGRTFGDGNGSIYDYDDTPTIGSGSYGSFQVHNMTSKTTVFAWNGHGQPTVPIGFGDNNAQNIHYTPVSGGAYGLDIC
jgi:hypothetical protein